MSDMRKFAKKAFPRSFISIAYRKVVRKQLNRNMAFVSQGLNRLFSKRHNGYAVAARGLLEQHAGFNLAGT
jgi:hypothetical protein